MSDPATITKLLQQTLIGNTQSIKQAQNSLKSLHNDPKFIHNLLLIPIQTSVPYNIQKASILYTLTLARDYIAMKNSEKMNEMVNILVDFMLKQNIQITLMKHLSLTVQTILTFDKDYGIRRCFQNNFVQALQQAVNLPDQSVKFQFLGLCAQISMGSTLHITKQFNQFLKNSLINYINISIRVIVHVQNSFASNNREYIISCLRGLKIYSYANKIYFRKIVYADLSAIKLLYDESISRLLMMAMQLNIGKNQLSTNIIFFQRNPDNDIVQLLNSIKADYITSMAYLTRTIIQNFKQPKMVLSHNLLQNQNLFPTVIISIKQLLEKCPYHKIKSKSTVKLVEQLYNLLIISVRSNIFFNIFSQQKKNILNGCIFNTLLFSPTDYENYFYEPDQFINQIIQIIEMDPNQYLLSRKKQTGLDSEGYEQIQNYNTLRTVASTLLNNFGKNIHGTIPQIFQYAFGILNNDQQKPQIPKTLLLLLIGILRDQILNRQNYINDATLILMKVLCSRQIPKTGTKSLEQIEYEQKQRSLEYIMLLIVLYKYLPKIKDIEDKVLPAISQIINTILNEPNCSDGLKYICFDLVSVVVTLQNQITGNYSLEFVKLMNILLINQYKHAQKILQTMFHLYKYKDLDISKSPQLLVGTVQHLSQIIHKEVQLNQQSITKLNINKAWNIITDISQNQLFIPQYIDHIQNAVMPLLKFIDGVRELDYQQNIFMMMTSFINKSKNVTQNQLVMFQIIPKLFYTQYHRLFGHSFQTLQIFIRFGSNILVSAPQAMNMIIDMCICSMETTTVKISHDITRTHNESQNSEGILILHSLMLSCGNALTPEMWMKLAKSFTNRLTNPPVTTNILKSNLIAAISIMVMVGNQNFSVEDNDVLLNNVLQLYPCCTFKYPAKVLIVCLSELMSNPTLGFIQNRFNYVLDTVVSLLQLMNQGQKILKRKAISQTERDYDIIESLVQNKITQIDELQYFKSKIKDLKQKYPQEIHQSFEELPQQKKAYLKDIMSMQNVVGEKRKIFKIARN